MKKKFTILGCGSSLGSPWITDYKGNLSNNPKNIRSRCCAHIQYGDISISIDTSPDIKNQFLKNKIKSLDAIIYTHEHADQTAGIFEMRPFFGKMKKKYLCTEVIELLKLLRRPIHIVFMKDLVIDQLCRLRLLKIDLIFKNKNKIFQ